MSEHPLLNIQTDLQIIVEAMCKHLRNKSFTSPETEHNGIMLLVNSQVMADELCQIINHHTWIEETLTSHLNGCEGKKLWESPSIPGIIDKEETIYEQCLYYFEKVECPLGRSTDALKNWVKSYPERVQTLHDLRETYEKMLGFTSDPELIARQTQQISQINDAERFVMDSNEYLRLIEQSNVLDDYNERMLRVQAMLSTKAPIEAILSTLKSA